MEKAVPNIQKVPSGRIPFSVRMQGLTRTNVHIFSALARAKVKLIMSDGRAKTGRR